MYICCKFFCLICCSRLNLMRVERSTLLIASLIHNATQLQCIFLWLMIQKWLNLLQYQFWAVLMQTIYKTRKYCNRLARVFWSEKEKKDAPAFLLWETKLALNNAHCKLHYTQRNADSLEMRKCTVAVRERVHFPFQLAHLREREYWLRRSSPMKRGQL